MANLANEKSIIDNSPAELAKKASTGDAAAFERLYCLFRRSVYDLCLRLTRNVSDSEDLTQEVFLQIYRKIGAFRGEAAFATWLYRVARNIVMMHFRRQRIEPLPLAFPELHENLIDIAASSYFGTSYGLFAHFALRRAITSLPDGRRNVVILHDIGGFTHREVGRQLGIEASTSKSQLHRAHRKLRQALGGTRAANNAGPRTACSVPGA